MMNYLEALLTTAKVLDKISEADRKESVQAETKESQLSADEQYEQDLANLLRRM